MKSGRFLLLDIFVGAVVFFVTLPLLFVCVSRLTRVLPQEAGTLAFWLVSIPWMIGSLVITMLIMERVARRSR